MLLTKPASLWLRVRRSRSGMPPLLPTVVLSALVVCALFAPIIAPQPPNEGSLSNRLLPPVWMEGGTRDFILGTDSLGRDILSRIIFGARVSLAVSLTAIFFGGLVGTTVGLIAGYFGGLVDDLLMRLVDVAFALPTILLALLLAALLGPGLGSIILVVVLIVWSRFARQIRGEVLSVKERDFVALAKVAGCSSARIILVHIFPNVVNTLIVLATLQVGTVILLEAGLSFLGVGIPPPGPAWGMMVARGRDLVATAFWVSLFPGLAILLTVLSLNLFGDWLRDSLDPRSRQT